MDLQYLPCGTYGFLSCVCEGILVGVDNLALDLVGPASVVSQASSDHTNITLGHTKSLAIIERLNSSDKIQVLLDQIGELNQQLASVLWCLLSPGSLECLAGGSYCNIDILLGGLGDGADNFLSSGVDGLESLSVDTLNPFVVDEPGE